MGLADCRTSCMQTPLDIERLGINGEGVAHLDGYTIFVDAALPQEKIVAKIVEKRKTFARAIPLQIVSSSPHRQVPPCPVFGKCGGCQLMHLSYSQQLVFKRQKVVDALERIGKIPSPPVSPCTPSPSPLAYRNKIQLPVDADFNMGLYAKNSHDLVLIDRCYIHCDLGEAAFQTVRLILKKGRRFPLRSLLIKTSIYTREILVVLVTCEPASSFLKEIAHKILEALPEIKGVVHNFNPTEGNTVLGGTFSLLAGKESIEEQLGSLKFKVSSSSFFQVNPPLALKLYQKAIELADLQGTETVLDAYCGVGTLSLHIAQKAGHVIGVEVNPDAIADAYKNRDDNHLSNLSFHCAPVETFILSHQEPIDVVFLNPPRKGCDPEVLTALGKIKPSRVIYISCDPATLSRDLFLLQKSGYHIKSVHPFDMFPQTAHVETVACLHLSSN